MRPDEERQAEPGHARGAHGMDGDEKIEAGEDRRETINKDTDDGGRYCGIWINAAERRVKSPAGIEAAGCEGIQDEAAANEVDIPAQKINLREGEILGADHDRNQKIAEDGGNRRNQEKENHRDAMHRE